MFPIVPHFELTDAGTDAGAHLITVSGEVHVTTAPQLSERITEVVEQGNTALVLDLTNVELIDSTGLHALLNALRLVTQCHGRLALVATNPTVLRLFQITGLEKTFDIFETREAAIAFVTQDDGGSSAGAP